MVHAIVSQFSTACFPKIRRLVILLFSFLGLSDGCHSTGYAIAFLYPSDLLAYTY
jgi:hypothetical protein